MPFVRDESLMFFSGPGGRIWGEDLGPFYAIEVEGEWIWEDITRYIQNVEYETATDMCDKLKIQVLNPAHQFDVIGMPEDPENQSLPDFTTNRIFLPGNFIDVFAGYGPYSRAIHLGRTRVWRHIPRFPQEGIAGLDVIGYDAAKTMMGERSEIKVVGDGRTERRGAADDEEGAVFPQMTHSEVVRNIADKYGYVPDVDDTDRVDDVVQKRDMSDFALVRGLANINSRDFWVDYDYFGLKSWVLHWKRPPDNESPIYTFRYRQGNQSTLLSFEPEYNLDDGVTELKVMYFDRASGQWTYLTEEGATEAEADPRYRRGGSRGSRNTPSRRSDGRVRAGDAGSSIEEGITSASSLRLAAAGHAIDVIADRPFTSVADALDFARRWMRARRNSFIMATGTIVGVETLKARQVHRLEGLGARLDGDWYFTMARHKLFPDQGYTVEFKAHKVLEQ